MSDMTKKGIVLRNGCRRMMVVFSIMLIFAMGVESFADTFVVTSTFAGTDNSTTAAAMNISFSSTNEVLWNAHILVNGVEMAQATVMVGFKKGGWFSSNKDTARIIGSPSSGIWARVRIDGVALTPYMYSGLPMQTTNTTTEHVNSPAFLCAFGTYVIE